MISIIVPLGNKPGIVLLLSVSLPAGIIIVTVVVPREKKKRFSRKSIYSNQSNLRYAHCTPVQPSKQLH